MDILILFPFTLSCALCDVMTKRIPNRLILCGLIGAVLSRAALACRNPVSLADALAGFLLPWLLIGPLAALKMFGGGDVKLLSVLGLWLGARSCLCVMWYSLLIAAVWSAIVVIRQRSLMQRFHRLYRYTGLVLRSGRLLPYRGRGPHDAVPCPDSFPEAMDSSGEFCFAVPVFLALWLIV